MTLTLSAIVIAILGVVLTSQITKRLLDGKISGAVEQMDRARVTVEARMTGSLAPDSVREKLEAARMDLSTQAGGSAQSTRPAGSFDSVLIVPTVGGPPIESGPADEIPPGLRRYVQQGLVAYQFTTVDDPVGYRGQALIVGSPTTSDVSALELYLVFPLGSEARSLSLMRGTIMVGAGVLLLALGLISVLVARQVVMPIRSASRIAVRFADGRLKERMVVRGEDDLAKLAMSFNEMAESLSRQINQLEEFGNLQRRFTSDVSHELRTPLTTVRMAADLIHEAGDALDPALRRSAELLVTELDRFEALLNDLLEISRHDAGMAELACEQLDLRLCTRAAIQTVRHLAKEAATELIVDLPEHPVIAEVDPRRVERVLRNLLANAIDHSEGKPVLIRMRADEDAVAVVVRDQGVGLKPGEEKLAFNRFWRSDPSRVRRSGGSGLGLAISYEDARLHNGKLEAWGEPGAGASFRLTLPLIRGRKVVGSPLPLRPAVRRRARQAAVDGAPDPTVVELPSPDQLILEYPVAQQDPDNDGGETNADQDGSDSAIGSAGETGR
ncbi:MAG: HAMP domain-containing histidine kinase [Mycobacteriaceae bacterium]|nr:HAMP domain-containing histidine kinase [Mycobacteriaceae bacterium]